jgi:hypothetical protein
MQRGKSADLDVGWKSKKDSPEPPETVLRLSRLEEHVTVAKIVQACCRNIADK